MTLVEEYSVDGLHWTSDEDDRTPFSPILSGPMPYTFTRIRDTEQNRVRSFHARRVADDFTHDLTIHFQSYPLDDEWFVECSVLYPAQSIEQHPILVEYATGANEPDPQAVAQQACMDIFQYIQDPKGWMREYIELRSSDLGRKIAYAQRRAERLRQQVYETIKQVQVEQRQYEIAEEELAQLVARREVS